MHTHFKQRRHLLGLIASSAALTACGGGGGGETPAAAAPVTATPTTPVTTTPATPVTTTPTTPVSTTPSTDPAPTTPVTEPTTPVSEPTTPSIAKSAKRGIAYELTSAADMKALAPGVSWFYNWGTAPRANQTVAAMQSAYQLDYMPMLWGAGGDTAAMTTYLLANPGIKYLLLMNEPNLVDQAKLTPAQAAAEWPRYEAIARATGVKLVGQDGNSGRSPQIDYLAFHWYDYGLGGQLDRLLKYGKPFWVTEMANWHSGNDGAQIDTLSKQKTQMTEMVALCEGRADVFRYAWFIGRMGPEGDPHFTSLLRADGVLTELGQLYVSLPYKT
jgi:hypothetical protein